MNKFLMSESEKQRILEMHKTAVEKNVIYEAPTATPTPTPKPAASAAIPVQATFNCKYDGKDAVATVRGSFTKPHKPSDYISVMVDGKTIVRLELNKTDLVYYFDKNYSSAVGVENMNMTIKKPKKPHTAISEVISQINKGTGTNLRLSSDVIKAFNKLRSGNTQYAKTPMPNKLKPLGSSPNASLFRKLDPETDAILDTELWLGIQDYSYRKDKDGKLITYRGSPYLYSQFRNENLKAYFKENHQELKNILNGLWAELEPNLKGAVTK